MKIMIDFETRGRVNLKEAGLYAYAEHPQTDIICCAVKIEDGQTRIWINPKFKHVVPDTKMPVISDADFLEILTTASEIHAYNAQFERVMYRAILEKRQGFPALPMTVWRCTSIKAAYFSISSSLGLGRACEVMNVREGKDYEGYKVMMRVSVPNKTTGEWIEAAWDYEALYKYCIQDVEAEYKLDKTLLPLPDDEQKMYELDQKINDKGVYVDAEAVSNLIWKVEEKQRRLLLKVQAVTAGKIRSTRQTEATKTWLREQGVDLENLQKETVKAAIASNIPFAAQELLGLRQALAKSSVAKLAAMKRMLCKDSRIRGALQFYGADRTGRWAGRGIQPQNLQRDSFKDEDIDKILKMGVAEVDEKYTCTMVAASKSLRGMLCAAPGKKILCADFASIEARLLAWFADEEKSLEAFRRKEDIYVLNASEIFHVPKETVTKDQRLIGKVCELALGYQGWLGAFDSMASVYGVSLEAEKTKGLPEEQAKEIRDEKAKEIILGWRAARQKTVNFWAGVLAAAVQSVKTGHAYSYGKVKFGMRGRFLHCRLPSGRLLSYCDPTIEVVKTKYGVEKEVIAFMGWNSEINKWGKQHTYGGKLTENIVQATARDVLRDALLRLDAAGFDTVLHIHDEVLAEDDDYLERLELFETIMAQVPDWAEGCPIGVEGWAGKRYRK